MLWHILTVNNLPVLQQQHTGAAFVNEPNFHGEFICGRHASDNAPYSICETCRKEKNSSIKAQQCSLPIALAWKVMQLPPSVRLFVCPFVSTLSLELIDCCSEGTEGQGHGSD